VWSNLLSPVSANYLPGSSGSNGDSYIMVGVDGSNVAHVGVSVDADATLLPKLKASICYFGSGRSYIFCSPPGSFAGDGTTSLDMSSFPLDSDIYSSKYFVVVWEDKNGSGVYNPKDKSVDSSGWGEIIFTDQSILSEMYANLDLVWAAWALYPTAQNFLNAFMKGTAPSGVTSVGSMTIPPNYAVLSATLHHNTGVLWTSSTAGTIPLYIFNNSTSVSKIVQANTDFRNTIKSTMTSESAINDVQNFDFGSAPDHWFSWAGPTTITFNLGAYYVVDDLYFAMRHANLSNYTVWVRVQAGTLKVLQVAIYGNVNCTYSFNFDEKANFPLPIPGISNAFKWGALLQSGYSGSSNSEGQVFYYQVSFDNTNIDMPYTYPPP
jgi:hypothetical protein